MTEPTTLHAAPAVEPADYTALTQDVALLTRADAGALRLTDADRADFLQRMTTNNIQVLQPGQGTVTVLTSPTARVLFVFSVLAQPDALLVLPMPTQTAALARHLRGQIFFMDKVKVENLSEQWTRLRLMGPQAAALLSKIGADVHDLPAHGWRSHDDALLIAQPNFDVPGYELLVPTERVADWQARLAAQGARAIGDAAYTTRSIELGIPQLGAELSEAYTPLEIGLSWTCADNKGCYTGQEIIARQITYDKVTKYLVSLHSAAPLAPGSEVMLDGRSVGTITSVAHSPAHGPVALAIVKRPHHQPGTAVIVEGVAAQIAALPMTHS